MDTPETRIRAAARAIFGQHGYKAASMADIARRAGVAVGSLYTYYPSKQALFFEIYFAENVRTKQEIAANIDWSEPRQALKAFIAQTTDASRNNRILQVWVEPGIGERLKRECVARQQCREFRPFLYHVAQQWRQSGALPATYSDAFLEELFELANQIDASLLASDAARAWLIEAMVEKLFP